MDPETSCWCQTKNCGVAEVNLDSIDQSFAFYIDSAISELGTMLVSDWTREASLGTEPEELVWWNSRIISSQRSSPVSRTRGPFSRHLSCCEITLFIGILIHIIVELKTAIMSSSRFASRNGYPKLEYAEFLGAETNGKITKEVPASVSCYLN